MDLHPSRRSTRLGNPNRFVTGCRQTCLIFAQEGQIFIIETVTKSAFCSWGKHYLYFPKLSIHSWKDSPGQKLTVPLFASHPERDPWRTISQYLSHQVSGGKYCHLFTGGRGIKLVIWIVNQWSLHCNRRSLKGTRYLEHLPSGSFQVLHR